MLDQDPSVSYRRRGPAVVVDGHANVYFAD
jgi:hypothetical protein